MDNWPVTLWTAGMTGVGQEEKVISLAIIINSPGTGTYGDCDICLKNLFTSRSSLCGGCTLEWFECRNWKYLYYSNNSLRSSLQCMWIAFNYSLYGFEINQDEKCQLLCWSTILNWKLHWLCCSWKISKMPLMMPIECSKQFQSIEHIIRINPSKIMQQ